MTKYKVVTYNGNTGHFKENWFDVYELEDAIYLMQIVCNDIIDAFLHDGIRMKVSMLGFANAIRIFSVNDEKNYYVVFLKKVETED